MIQPGFILGLGIVPRPVEKAIEHLERNPVVGPRVGPVFTLGSSILTSAPHSICNPRRHLVEYHPDIVPDISGPIDQEQFVDAMSAFRGSNQLCQRPCLQPDAKWGLTGSVSHLTKVDGQD